MSRLVDEITYFLETNGFGCSHRICHGFDVIYTITSVSRQKKTIIPLEISSTSSADAERKGDATYRCINDLTESSGYPLIITEDRWREKNIMIKARILAHLEIFNQAYARNCEVRRIEKAEAIAFLQKCHSYGYAACRYHYGLFLKRHTGHIALGIHESVPREEEMVAVATFSNARKWIKDGNEIRSYEWTRYASLPDMRINGGMGKMLKAFIEEVKPDDIMSYADLEWSEGKVYERLGFHKETKKCPVLFTIDRTTWKRIPYHKNDNFECGSLFFRNFGSNKYRLKLTEYK